MPLEHCAPDACRCDVEERPRCIEHCCSRNLVLAETRCVDGTWRCPESLPFRVEDCAGFECTCLDRIAGIADTCTADDRLVCELTPENLSKVFWPDSIVACSTCEGFEGPVETSQYRCDCIEGEVHCERPR